MFVIEGPYRSIEDVPAAQTDQVLGGVGAIGDIIKRLICRVATAATSQVLIQDGAGTAVEVLAANTPVGTYTVELEVESLAGAWSVTTAAGVAVTAIGKFSA